MSDLIVIKKELKSEQFIQRFQELNLFKLNVEQEMAFAIQAMQNNPYLLKANKESIITSILNASLTGITLNPTLAQGYLVPRKKGGQLQCVLEIGYQGYITKIHEYEVAKNVWANVIYEGCEYNIDVGTDKKLTHKPYYMVGNEKGKEIGAYAVAILPSGEPTFEFLPISRIEEVAAMSESYKSDKSKNTKYSPWSTSREEMIKKTLIRYIWKYLPKPTQGAKALEEVINTHDNDFFKPVKETTDTGKVIELKEEKTATKESIVKDVKEEKELFPTD